MKNNLISKSIIFIILIGTLLTAFNLLGWSTLIKQETIFGTKIYIFNISQYLTNLSKVIDQLKTMPDSINNAGQFKTDWTNIENIVKSIANIFIYLINILSTPIIFITQIISIILTLLGMDTNKNPFYLMSNNGNIFFLQYIPIN